MPAPWMFDLTLQFRSFLPQRDSGTVLPAALAALLLVGIPLQLAFGVDTMTPPASPGTVRVARAAPPAVAAVVAPANILDRNIFVPPILKPGGTAAANAALGGVTIAGSVAVRGRRLAMVVRPGGRMAYLAPGATLDGWVLAAIDADAARFRKDGKTLAIPYGAPVAVPAAETEEPQDQ
jgi:hypothetical protein